MSHSMTNCLSSSSRLFRKPMSMRFTATHSTDSLQACASGEEDGV